MMERLAVISDVHGNRLALEAVLRDIHEKKTDAVINLGDCLYGPLDPAGTADLLISQDLLTVRGNQDREIIDAQANLEGSQSLAFTRSRLTAKHLDWLTGLPATTVAFDEFFLCHGTPARDDQYLLHDIVSKGAVPRATPQLEAMLQKIPQPVILCGHDHTPAVVSLPNGKLIVNPGSVGLQAYSDDLPVPHLMQTGSPHARYAILDRRSDSWRVEIVKVPYDWAAAASQAKENGRPDWPYSLLTGRARR